MNCKAIVIGVCGAFLASCQTITETKLAENVYPSQNLSAVDSLKACSFDAGYAFGKKGKNVKTTCSNYEFVAGYKKGKSKFWDNSLRDSNMLSGSANN